MKYDIYDMTSVWSVSAAGHSKLILNRKCLWAKPYLTKQNMPNSDVNINGQKGQT